MTEKDLDVAIEKCERIMEMDTRTMQNPVAENGWIFEKVYDLLKYLRQFQFATDTNVCGTDTISRAAALKGLEDLNIASFYEENEHSKEAYTEVKTMLKALPSAQPEIIRCKDCRHNHNCDIQYHAQAGDMFFCAGAERRTDD